VVQLGPALRRGNPNVSQLYSRHSGEFQVNTKTYGNQRHSSTVPLAGGPRRKPGPMNP
jgi:hypothetical protein